MGIKDCRIPVYDLLNPRISDRVKQLSALGHRFTIVMFGLPNEERLTALAEHSAGIKAIEVVGLFDQWPEFAVPLKELRQRSDFEIYLHAVRPEVEGWTSTHGMHVDLTDEVDWVLSQADLVDAIDGFVFGIRHDMPPFDGYTAARQCLSGTNYKPQLHVPSVSMFWATVPNDVVGENEELARVAEATLLARANPDISVVIDNFVEIDRGYCSCRGLVDRLYNPKDGSRVVRSLNTLLPQQLSDLQSMQTTGGRILSAEGDGGRVLLVLPNISPAADDLTDDLPDDMTNRQGVLITLADGEKVNTCLANVIEARAREKAPQSPALFLFND